MAKTLMMNKTARRQKDWKFFAIVISLQILFVVIGYFLSSI